MAEEAVKSLTDIQQYPTYIKPYQENLQKSSEARGQITGAKEGMEAERSVAREQARAKVETDFAKKFAEAPQRQELEKVSSEVAAPFVPTRDNAQSLAAIFMLTNIAGFAMGAGGKRNAQAAMSGMNGMLEGYQRGRQDLYRKEKDAFDTNIKQLKTRYDMLDRQLKEALETYKTDKQAGLQQAEIAYAQAGADFYKKYADKFGLAAMYEFHKQAKDNADKMWTETRREEDRAERLNRAARSEERAIRREERSEIRLDRMINKATTVTSKKEGKPLPDKQARDIEGLSSIEDGLLKLKEDWKPEYAQAGLPAIMGGFGAQLKADLERRFGKQTSQGMISWWSRYQRYQAPNRHALFGATLTGNELKNYQTFTATINDAPKTVETMLDDQINYVRSTAANKIFNAESMGYRVPEARRVSFEQTFGGGTGSTGAAQTPSAPAAGAQVDVNTERKNAKAAIAAGAPESAVRQRFKQKTGQEL